MVAPRRIDAGFIMAPDQRVYQRVFYTVGFVRARYAIL